MDGDVTKINNSKICQIKLRKGTRNNSRSSTTALPLLNKAVVGVKYEANLNKTLGNKGGHKGG